MAVITNVEEFENGTLAYRNYTTLIDGKYNVSIVEAESGSLPAKTALLSGDGDDTLNIETYRDLKGTYTLGAGNDFLSIVSGSDETHSGIVHGGAGNDTMSGYLLAALYGDGGNDILYSAGEVFGGDGDDTVRSEDTAHGGAGNDTVNGRETAHGDGGDDNVWSNIDAYGDAGNDMVHSRGQAYGGTGNDTVVSDRAAAFGDDGNDVVTGFYSASGGNGDDIVSATGTAALTGGAGNDVFLFAKEQLGFSYETRDKITDFELGRDKIDLKAFADADISVVHDTKYDLVKIDTNHDHKTDFLIQVAVVGGGALDMGDILIA